MDNLFSQKVINANNVFADDFLDVKILYLYSFNMLPSIHFVSHIDAEKAFEAIREKFAENIRIYISGNGIRRKRNGLSLITRL
jgi:hypothetical protein